MSGAKRRAVIIGAAGRDFHNFNTFFRDNPSYEVVCFTAEQIPGIAGRKYPPVLAGAFYPLGIPIEEEKNLEKIIEQNNVDIAVLSYSDLPYSKVGNISARVNAAGADFWLLGPNATQIKAEKPVVAVCAVRTGSGKSQTSRYISKLLNEAGRKCVAIRHPMPYGDLAKQAVQRFASYADLEKHECTIEEMEEYEPYIERGLVVYAGVDYRAILNEAQKEADVILWDGGNNDYAFFVPDLLITVADPHRPGHEISYYPGEVNVRMADVVIINKVDSAKPEDIALVEENVRKANPYAKIIKAVSKVTLERENELRNKRVLVIEDGPTLTHGDMNYGAGIVAAKKASAVVIDARPYAVGSIKATYQKYSHLDAILPAMGYGQKQMDELRQTIENASKDIDAIIIGTPIDLAGHIRINKPCHRVTYEYVDANAELKKILQEKRIL
ncbi:TPA: GTPase [Candidatus Micrarchaeota archaeon]|nr:MAG: GTPase [Candidatus Micrarchaeota archaeon CG1_02_51_15]HII38507.1 GTPase [Candidatus Micrarchaeota archaeon]